MNYCVPDLTLDAVLNLEKSLNQIVPEREFRFDFSHMTNFDPLPMLMAGAIIKRYRRQHPNVYFSVGGINTKGKNYAGTMGFFKYISPALGIGKAPGEALGSLNYIPITLISIDALQQAEYEQGNYIALGDIIEKESGRLARIVDRGQSELNKLLTYLIREILRNTPEHAQTNQMWVCGQYWPSYELAEIAIIDEGIGIYQSIVQNPSHREYIKDNATALQWAIKAGISQSFRPSAKQKSRDEWANSGFGLYMVSEI